MLQSVEKYTQKPEMEFKWTVAMVIAFMLPRQAWHCENMEYVDPDHSVRCLWAVRSKPVALKGKARSLYSGNSVYGRLKVSVLGKIKHGEGTEGEKKLVGEHCPGGSKQQSMSCFHISSPLLTPPSCSRAWLFSHVQESLWGWFSRRL